MKTKIATLAFLFVGFGLFAQEPSDTTKFKFGDKRVILIDDHPTDSTDVSWEDDEKDCGKSQLTYWDGVDFGVNILLNKDGKTTFEGDEEWLQLDYARSFSWRFNIFEGKLRLFDDYVGIVSGAGITYNSYGLKNNVTLVNVDDSTFAVPDTLINFSKNKLRASYVNVPLMLEFNTSKDCDKNVHVAAGVIGGWRMGSITKQRFDVNDNEVRSRVKNDFNMTNFTLDATVRVGYRNLTLFATYGLTPLFEDDKGPEVYPVTVGIALVPFS
ncbi:MAG: outer membrane beta-barrel protein [Flavobacteriales bacterium]|nr:outer membrane beta-barrel protein [Flavobacteriales bacterium]